MLVFWITLATVISTLLGGLFAIKYKDKLHLILGLSAGTILGVALFDILPESLELSLDAYPIEVIMGVTAIGFTGYLILDRYFSLHCHGEHCEKELHNSKFGAATLVLHSFLDGLGIGLAFKISPAVGWTVAVAVLIHKFSDGVNAVNVILRNKGKEKDAYAWLTADAIAPALGVLAAFWITISEPVLGLMLAFFVGLFLYLSASDLIPESHHNHPTVWTTAMTVLGIALMYFVVRFAK